MTPAVSVGGSIPAAQLRADLEALLTQPRSTKEAAAALVPAVDDFLERLAEEWTADINGTITLRQRRDVIHMEQGQPPANPELYLQQQPIHQVREAIAQGQTFEALLAETKALSDALSAEAEAEGDLFEPAEALQIEVRCRAAGIPTCGEADVRSSGY
jgi:hypothetical protein